MPERSTGLCTVLSWHAVLSAAVLAEAAAVKAYAPQRKCWSMQGLLFGQHFTDHMFEVRHHGHHDAQSCKRSTHAPLLEGFLFTTWYRMPAGPVQCGMQVEHVFEEGWSRPTIRPFGPLALHPAASALHIGLSCFEGMKAYMGVDGRGRLFRRALIPA